LDILHFLFCVKREYHIQETLISQQGSGGTPQACDPLSGELWEVKKERIRKASVHGNLPGWDLRSVSSVYSKHFFFFNEHIGFE